MSRRPKVQKCLSITLQNLNVCVSNWFFAVQKSMSIMLQNINVCVSSMSLWDRIRIDNKVAMSLETLLQNIPIVILTCFWATTNLNKNLSQWLTKAPQWLTKINYGSHCHDYCLCSNGAQIGCERGTFLSENIFLQDT